MSAPPKDMHGRNQPWLVRPSSIRLMWRVGIAVLAVLTLADIGGRHHSHFALEGTFGFYSWYGFVTCAAMVVFAKLLGFVLKRKDTYYPAGDDAP